MQNFQHLTGMALAAIVTLSGASGAGAEVLAVAFPPHAPATAASPAAQVPDAAVTEMRGLRLVVDFAAILHVEGGMSVVAVGNPAIADASLVNQRTVIVTGHLAGTTNVIALDEAGRVLADVRVHVTSSGDATSSGVVTSGVATAGSVGGADGSGAVGPGVGAGPTMSGSAGVIPTGAAHGWACATHPPVATTPARATVARLRETARRRRARGTTREVVTEIRGATASA